MDLTDDDVRAILRLLETSPFSDLELETPEFRLTLHRTETGWTRESATSRPAHVLPRATAPELAEAVIPAQVSPTQALEPRSDVVDVRTPLPGTFYRAPKPGAPPFVELGTQVGADTVVGIVETMKLMNSVYAGIAGRVAEICLGDASFARQGAVLMRIAADRA
jgi:acetyl-CoA carboxylase biotin carboxyl carrier protein